jgi:hypothetical protein
MLAMLPIGCGKEEAPPSPPAVSVSHSSGDAELSVSDASSNIQKEGAASPDPSVRSISAMPSVRTAGGTDSPDVPSFLPLRKADVGETATYVDAAGKTLRYEIIKIDGEDVTTRVSMLDASGHPLGEPALRHNERDDDLLATQASGHAAQRQASRVSVDAAGKSWNALMFTDTWTDEGVHYVRRSWVSEDVPVFGLIRMELTGDNITEAKLELRSFATATK